MVDLNKATATALFRIFFDLIAFETSALVHLYFHGNQGSPSPEECHPMFTPLEILQKGPLSSNTGLFTFCNLRPPAKWHSNWRSTVSIGTTSMVDFPALIVYRRISLVGAPYQSQLISTSRKLKTNLTFAFFCIFRWVLYHTIPPKRKLRFSQCKRNPSATHQLTQIFIFMYPNNGNTLGLTAFFPTGNST